MLFLAETCRLTKKRLYGSVGLYSERRQKQQRRKERIYGNTNGRNRPEQKDFRSAKKVKTAGELAKDIKGIGDIKIKRFILREMILLALADHELTDEEIQTIYQIGTCSGLKEEKISDFFLWAAKGIEWQIEGTQLVEDNL